MIVDRKYVLGIDPGVSGGMGLVLAERSDGDSWVYSVEKCLHGSDCHDEDDFACLGTRRKRIVSNRVIFDFSNFPLDCCVIERQQDRNDQAGGAQMMFNYGRWSSMCEDYFGRDGVFYASPSNWKPEMGLSKDKSRSLRLATEIFGDSAAKEHWPRKKDDGVAEAVLLAYWRARKLISFGG